MKLSTMKLENTKCITDASWVCDKYGACDKSRAQVLFLPHPSDLLSHTHSIPSQQYSARLRLGHALLCLCNHDFKTFEISKYSHSS